MQSKVVSRKDVVEAIRPIIEEYKNNRCISHGTCIIEYQIADGKIIFATFLEKESTKFY